MKRIVALLLAFLMAVLAAGCRADGKNATAVNGDESDKDTYADLLFDTAKVHTIDVTMSEKDRADQMAEPKSKTKYSADVVIDGEEVKGITFKTKGNSSLYFVVDAGKDKFSYGIDFDKDDNGQTFHGLDKLNLQNNFSDATSMKEYIAYYLFRKMGVAAPLASYSMLTVNGEEQGLYTVIEDTEESFLERISAGEGTIYKPEDKNMGLNDKELERLNNGGIAAHDSDGGTDIVYRGDDEKSYPDIFENAQTKDDEKTRANVIRALKALSEKKDLDKYLDTKEIIRYFAVHDYLVAYDSYTGPMLHNYLLYENNGKLGMLPWDYDIAFGTFPDNAKMGADIDSGKVINTGIDSPLGVVPNEERPMWNFILSDEKYRAEYHDALSELVDVIGAEEVKKEARRIYDLISPYIAEDPKAYYTPEKFKKAYETLIRFTDLRAESIRRQVEGQLAAESSLQKDEDKVDASDIYINDMGTVQDLNS